MSALLQSIADVSEELAAASMALEVTQGLSSQPKQLPSKFFYDAEGSRLFEEICRQPEYDLMRTEIEILERFGADMAQAIGPDVRIVEFGSGSGIKTRLLLSHLINPASYTPIEISLDALHESLKNLKREFPLLPVAAFAADFTQPFHLPHTNARRTLLFFPGSTIGNFDTPNALRILRNVHAAVGRDGGAIIGIDLRKGVAETEAAYNDAAGVTARFTLNMLAHINRELGADFDLSRFAHRARYDATVGRIETHLISLAEQVVNVAGATFPFELNEAMLVEYSHKYTLEEFEMLGWRAGFRIDKVWTDDRQRFAVVNLVSTPVQDSHLGNRR
ncbi:MAG: L-histidine N(alpha)-methyltransferase [Paucibacter sp.]|nr:L-histidine N(alpha)-methyltransferase [Roseateles sp.]